MQSCLELFSCTINLSISGPPGTGKTHTINAMIEAIGGGVIVTAPSNAAVANVALKVYSSSYHSFSRILVFGQNCDPSVRFLNPLHRGAKFREFKEQYNLLIHDDAKSRLQREFARWLNLGEEDTDISYLAQLCPHINLETKEGRRMYQSMLGSAAIIFCTLNSSGSKMLREAAEGTFSTFILDEAGQCTESGELSAP